MKKCFILFALTLFCLPLLAQQDDVLGATDTAGTITIHEGPNVKRILRYQQELNELKGDKTEGYRIEIFFGKNREDAQKMKKRFENLYDSIPCDVEFEKPFLRVRVGNFRSKLEAQQLYYALKKEFDSVIIVKLERMDYPPLD